MRAFLPGLALAVLLAFAASGNAVVAGSSAPYLGASYVVVGTFGVGAGLCQEPASPSPYGIGQVCYLKPPSLPQVTISVADDVLASGVKFRWVGFTDPNPPNEPNPLPCGPEGAGTDVATVQLPPPCGNVLIRLVAGTAVKGTVTLT